MYIHIQTPFQDTHRMFILHHVMENQSEFGGLELKLERLQDVEKGSKLPIILAVYPLHHAEKLFHLQCEWSSYRYFLPWQQPLKLIR